MKRRLLLTGATGFLGRTARPVLERDYAVEAVSRRECDLLDRAAVARLFERVRPAVVVHLAGHVGGLGLNRARPAELCHDNLVMNAVVIDAAARAGVEKLVALVGGCSYPADTPPPIPESALWRGFPQPDNAAYSAAKRMVPVLCEAYGCQFGLRSAIAIPGNVFGPFDNFSRTDSHVVPAMIRRFHEAARSGHPTVTCWGTGRPTRDFLYAGDLAECLPFLIEHYEGPAPLNIARGESTSIRALAELVAEVTGFGGTIAWDDSQPDGQPEKVLDSARMKALGLACPTPLRAGLERTYRWFVAHLEGGVRR